MTTYPADLLDDDGTIRVSGQLDFTDATDEPAYGGVRIYGPKAVAFDDTGLATGIAIGYTPAIGDLFSPVVVVTAAFDGTTPLLDIGFTGDTNGFFFAASGDKTALDVSDLDALTAFNVSGSVTLDGTTPVVSTPAWAKATAADALLYWCSQDGTKGGTAIGGTAGAASLYIVAATPRAF